MLYYLFVTLYVLTCVVLMIVILLQQGKGGDIANAFGGGASQAVFGARAGATVLTKVTTGLTVSFMTLALLLAVWGSRGTSSVVGGVDAPGAAPASSRGDGSWPGTRAGRRPRASDDSGERACGRARRDARPGSGRAAAGEEAVGRPPAASAAGGHN